MDWSTIVGGLQTTFTEGLGAVAPVALTIGGSIVVLTLGWRVFRQFAR